MATATATKKTAAKKAAVKTPAKANGAKKHPQFDQFMSEVLADPEARAAFEDATARTSVVDRLVARRNELGMTATDVAKIIGASQPMMSQFEAGKIQPNISMTQKYARAVGMRLAVSLERL